MNKKITDQQAIQLLKKIMPHGTVIKSTSDQAEIMDMYRQARETGLYVGGGSSLHCWDEQYAINGVRHHFIGIIGSNQIDVLHVYKSWEDVEAEQYNA